MTKKQILRFSAFMVAVAMLLLLLCDMFEYPASPITERYAKYKSFDEGTVDAVYIGSSAVDRYWIAGQAFEDYGMAVYPLSTERLPVWLMKNMAVEAVRHQSPQFLIFDVRSLVTRYDTQQYKWADTSSRRVIDMLDFFSANRQDAIRRTLDYMSVAYPEKVTRNDPSYFFSPIRYHSKWENEGIKLNDIIEPPSDYLGFFMKYPYTVSDATMSESSYSDAPAPLDSVCEKYLFELLDYLRENEIEAFFVDAPRHMTGQEDARCRTLYEILDQYGFAHLSYNSPEMWEAYPYETVGDFYNLNHVNYNGARKYTDYFSTYLHENFDLPDHRDDEAYADWYGTTEKIEAQVEEWKIRWAQELEKRRKGESPAVISDSSALESGSSD